MPGVGGTGPGYRRIEAAHATDGRLRWAVYGPGDVVITAYGDLDVDALYDALDASATTA